MSKSFAAPIVAASMLALLVGVIHYQPPAGSDVQQVQHQTGKRCPPGKMWNPYKQLCE